MDNLNGARWVATRFGLKLEIFIPFMLADGGGTLGTFWHALVIAFATVVINTVAEDVFTRAPGVRRYAYAAVFGLMIVALNGGMLYWWDAQRMLRDPIASYGVTVTVIVTGVAVIGLRLGLMFADDSSRKPRFMNEVSIEGKNRK